PDADGTDDGDADEADPDRQLDVPEDVGAGLVAPREEAGEGADDDLGPGEQAGHRGRDHDRGAPPEGPGVEDVDAAEGAVGAGLDFSNRDHPGDDDHEVEDHADHHADGGADDHEAAGAEHGQVGGGGEAELADVHAGEGRERRPAFLDQPVVPGVQVLGEVPG